MPLLFILFALGCGVFDDGRGDAAPPTSVHCESPREWGRDEDGDGYAARLTHEACATPGAGWTTQRGDCDDTDSRRYPGAEERCDPEGIDEDCDGPANDEEPGGAVDATTWYADTDGDGYGDDSTAFRSCTAEGYVTLGGDCRPDDPTIHPGAIDECQYDSVDEDCDGTPAAWYDEDGDGYGTRFVADCSEPRADASGDCVAEDPNIHPGAIEICGDGVDQNCDSVARPCGIAGTWNVDDEPPQLDQQVTDAGDLDGDGFADLVTFERASALVFAGPFGESPLAAEAAVLSATPSDAFDSVRLGDVDGDGRDELLASVGGYGADATVWIDYQARAGAVDDSGADLVVTGLWLTGEIRGPTGADELVGILLSDDGTSRSAVIGGVTTGAWAAHDVVLADFGEAGATPLGDVDGDGLADMAMYTGTEIGVIHGPVRGTWSSADADLQIASLWGRPSGAGDLDGDGLADLAVGVAGTVSGARDHCTAPPHQTVFVLHAPYATDVLDADATLVDGRLATVPQGFGDLDGDGSGELLLTYDWANCEGSTSVVMSGPFSGTLATEDAMAQFWTSLPGYYLKSAAITDLDGDGIEDLAYGGRDASWLFFGGRGP